MGVGLRMVCAAGGLVLGLQAATQFVAWTFAWAPALAWRMDKHFDKFRKEVPHLKQRPSEYLRQHVWWTTQPIEEPDQARHLTEIIDWIGWDRLLYSSDYPHWDYDNPSFSFKFPMTEAQRRMIFRDNAMALYRLS